MFKRLLGIFAVIITFVANVFVGNAFADTVNIPAGVLSADCTSSTFGADYTSGTVIFTAQWEPNTIILDWDENGGQVISNGSCTYDGDLILPAAPVRDGYVFTGWTLGDGTIKGENITVSGGCIIDYTGVDHGTSTIIRAEWEPLPCECIEDNGAINCTGTINSKGLCDYNWNCDGGYYSYVQNAYDQGHEYVASCEPCPEEYPNSDGTQNGPYSCYRDCSKTCTQKPCPEHSTCNYDIITVTGKEHYKGTCDAEDPGWCEINAICEEDYYLNDSVCVPCNVRTTNEGTETTETNLCPDGDTEKAHATSTTQTYSETCYRTHSPAGSTSSDACTGTDKCEKKIYKTCRVVTCEEGYSPNADKSACEPNAYKIDYDCTSGTGSVESTRVSYMGNYTLRQGSGCYYQGYSFNGWSCDNALEQSGVYNFTENTMCNAMWVPTACEHGYYLNDEQCELCPKEYPHSNGSRTSKTSCYKNCSKECSKPVCPENASCLYDVKTSSGYEYYGGECNAPDLDMCEVKISCNANYYLENANCTKCEEPVDKTGTDKTDNQKCPDSITSIPHATGTRQSYGRTCYKTKSPAGSTSSDACTGANNCEEKTYDTCYVLGCEDGYTVSDDETKCIPNTIILDWDENGGEIISDGECTYGEYLALPAAPVRDGYVFKGWKTADGVVRGENVVVQGGCLMPYIGVDHGISTVIQAQWEKTVCKPGEYLENNECKKCPTAYPYSDEGATKITQCYSDKKPREWTGEQRECVLPRFCSAKVCKECRVEVCYYVAYSNETGDGDGVLKSGCETNNEPCQQTVVDVTANVNGFVNEDGISCSPCSSYGDGSYTLSIGGDISYEQCYKKGVQECVQNKCVNPDPEKCSRVKCSSSCDCGTLEEYIEYADGVIEGTKTKECTLSVVWLEHKVNHYTESDLSGCPACPDGYTSTAGDDLGIEVCRRGCFVPCSEDDTASCPEHATCTYDKKHGEYGNQKYGEECDAKESLCPVNIVTCESGYTLNPVTNKCEANCNTVTLNMNGGRGGTTVLYKYTNDTEWYTGKSDVSKCTGLVFELPRLPYRDGHAYTGYFDSITGNENYIDHVGVLSTTWKIDGDRTIYAQWESDVIILDWDENGGEAISNGECTYGENLSLPAAPVRDGYVFKGWKTADGVVRGGNVVVQGGCLMPYIGVDHGISTVIQAQWEKLECKLGEYLENNECKKCPTAYPYSDAGATKITQCYSDEKPREWTGEQRECVLPRYCATKQCKECRVETCYYVVYSNETGDGDGVLKSGCETNNEPCKQTLVDVTAEVNGFVNGDGTSCSPCSSYGDGTYTLSPGGDVTYEQCYKKGVQTCVQNQCVNPDPERCNRIKCSSSCDCGTLGEYIEYADGTLEGTKTKECTLSVTWLEHKVNHYTKSDLSGCPACPEGYTSTAGDDLGIEVCSKVCFVPCSEDDTASCPEHAICTYDKKHGEYGNQKYGEECNAKASVCPMTVVTCDEGYTLNNATGQCEANCNTVTLDMNGGRGDTTVLYKYTDDTAWYTKKMAGTRCAGLVSELPSLPYRTAHTYTGHYNTVTGNENYIARTSALSTTWKINRDRTIYAQWDTVTCECTEENGATDCEAFITENNQCGYKWKCETGYYNAVQSVDNETGEYTASCIKCPDGYSSTDGSATDISQCYKPCSNTCAQTGCPTNATCSYDVTTSTGIQYYGKSCSALENACPVTVTCEEGYYNMTYVETSADHRYSKSHPNNSDVCWFDGVTINCTGTKAADLPAQEWVVPFDYGDVYGKSLCSTTSGSSYSIGNPDDTVNGKYCWCKLNKYVLDGTTKDARYTAWVSIPDASWSTYACSSYCADACAERVQKSADMRSVLFTGTDLYETCEMEDYSIEYILNGGNFPLTVSVPRTYNIRSNTITLPVPVKSGYSFVGWCDDSNLTENCAQIRTIRQGSVGNRIFYAKWNAVCESNRWFHVDDEKICLYETRQTRPTMVIKMRNGKLYYMNLSTDNTLPIHKDSGKKMHVKIGNVTYNVYDNSVFQ